MSPPGCRLSSNIDLFVSWCTALSAARSRLGVSVFVLQVRSSPHTPISWRSGLFQLEERGILDGWPRGPCVSGDFRPWDLNAGSSCERLRCQWTCCSCLTALYRSSSRPTIRHCSRPITVNWDGIYYWMLADASDNWFGMQVLSSVNSLFCHGC